MPTLASCRRFMLFAVVAVLGSASAPLAQTISGTLRGTVTDMSGAILPGVTVELSGEAQIGGAQTTVTDQRGQYRFQNLTPGTYSLRVGLQGFKSVARDLVRVEVGRTFDVDFRLARSWLYIPLGLFIALVVFQLLPLPTCWLETRPCSPALSV